MQSCPTCNRTYPDDAPAFCPNDGTRLLRGDATPAYDPMKTLVSTPNPAPTQAAPPPTQPPPQWQMPASQPQQGWQQPPQAASQNWGGGYYQQAGQNLPY